MSDKLKINRYSEKPMTVKERRALHNLGYIQSDLKGMSFEERTNIINNQIIKPGYTVPSKQDKLNQGAARVNKSLLPKLEKISRRTGIPLEQLKTGKWEKNKYYNLLGSERGIVNTYVAKMDSLKKQGWVPHAKEESEKKKTPYKIESFAFPSLKKEIQEQQQVNKVDTTIKQQDIQLQNRSNLTIPMSPGNKDHMPITNNNNKELSIVK